MLEELQMVINGLFYIWNSMPIRDKISLILFIVAAVILVNTVADFIERDGDDDEIL